ncbi:MAG: hypothetical protein H6721_28550 [Sandaracinus sp.]|nr:hypothetical protein [Sandaracinus sp.]
MSGAWLSRVGALVLLSGVIGCAADRSGLAIGDGGARDGQFDGGFMCPEGTFDLDGDGRCECTFSSDVESCDGIDNDCDPSTPDGASDPTVGMPCDGDDADRCEDGAFVCAAAGFACEEPTDNDAELCDGVEDDDCDGVIDEGCSCTGDDTRSCGSDEGECSRGLQRCVAGVFSSCEGGQGPVDEVCNALDDDCDGRSDEALAAGCWVDGDGDSYAMAGAASQCAPASGCPGGFTSRRPGSGAQDCNDGAMGINPGASEACDLVDQDCDGRVDEGVAFGCWNDGDRDGYPANGAAGRCVPAGGCPVGTTTRDPATASNRDCNDGNASIRPGATEVCNGVDDNCAGGADDGLPDGCWADGDRDGYAANGAAGQCAPAGGCPSGTTNRNPSNVANRDCNDGAATVNPGASEVCNGVDDDCAGGVDDGLANGCWADGDRDGYAPNGAAGQCAPAGGCPVGTTNRNPSSAANRDCNDGAAAVNPGATEVCNNVDDDCAGGVDNGVTRSCTSACGMGIETCSAGTFGGCTAPSPSAETCNGLDDDCNGTADDGLSVGCWADPDRDGYPASGAAGQCMPSGGCPVGTTNRSPEMASNIDCQPAVAAINPGATEVCDGTDNDCDPSNDDDECGANCQAAVSGSRIYVFCNRTNRNYSQASSDCAGIGTAIGSTGMGLASVNSLTEQNFVSSRAQAISASDWWFGLSFTAGSWVWADGTDAPQNALDVTHGYNNWFTTEPDGSGNCARLLTTGQWGDRACNDDLRYVCEGPNP